MTFNANRLPIPCYNLRADFSKAVSDKYSKCKFNTDNAKFTFTWLTQLRGIKFTGDSHDVLFLTK